MAFTSTGGQAEVQTAVTLMLLDKLPILQDQLVVEVSEAAGGKMSSRRLTLTVATDWEVDYMVKCGYYSDASYIMEMDMVDSSNTTVQDLCDIMEDHGMYLYEDSMKMGAISMTEMGATTSATGPASTTTTATAVADLADPASSLTQTSPTQTSATFMSRVRLHR
ncbi:unnamed protein product [Prorocentrum cordatum]|uniref:Uncharacterized protein n=1 Tax=Prorocentrum cordatum TaxID=2364126 RepID=A0ABN9QVJ4_9DINO|nr:unnamed protein product [Polarella glacialis]